jgi:hypothetical protein
MDMSKAALPPRQPHHTKADAEHPLFPLWRQHVSSCNRLLIQASDFRDWKTCYERELVNSNAASDPRYPRFLDWMNANQGGARKCPAGMFPHNFYFWIEGGRW